MRKNSTAWTYSRNMAPIMISNSLSPDSLYSRNRIRSSSASSISKPSGNTLDRILLRPLPGSQGSGFFLSGGGLSGSDRPGSRTASNVGGRTVSGGSPSGTQTYCPVFPWYLYMELPPELPKGQPCQSGHFCKFQGPIHFCPAFFSQIRFHSLQ